MKSHVHFSVVVPEQIGVDVVWPEYHRVAPRGVVKGVRRLEDDADGAVFHAEVLARHVELSVAVSQGRGKHAFLLADGVPAHAWELAVAVPDVADELPVDQVLGGVDREAGEGDEGRRDAEEGSIVLDARWIRVPARQDRVGVRC